MNNFYTGEERKFIYRMGVDVDLTMVDSLTPWVNWFNEENETAAKLPRVNGESFTWSPFKPITRQCYIDHAGDLAILMRERAHPRWLHRRVFLLGQWMEGSSGKDPMDYWRRPDLYASMTPLVGSRQFLDNLKNLLVDNFGFQDVEYVAVSKCEPEHERSKRQFVSKHYGDLFSGFISTDEKHLVAIDSLLDDNPKYVEPCSLNNIYSIYVPQGNYGSLDFMSNDTSDMLFIKPDGVNNHFKFLNDNLYTVAQLLASHFDYVR